MRKQRLFYIGCLFLVGCASVPLHETFSKRLVSGDEHVNWALTYFESWRRDRQPRYLTLSLDHTQAAIDTFYQLQQDTSPIVTEFYIVKERRMHSCRMLFELQQHTSSAMAGKLAQSQQQCVL